MGYRIHRCLLRARRFPQENVVKQTRVGVSATYTYDLEIEYGIYSQKAYFEASEKMMQINKNPELLSPFLPLLGLSNLLPLTRMKCFGLQGFRLPAEKSYTICLVNGKLVVKIIFSSMMYVLIVLGSLS